MLSVASLLNPVKPEPWALRRLDSPSSPLCSSSSTSGSPFLSLTNQSSSKKAKMTKDGAVFSKGTPKGEVNFPPFERFDEDVLREVQKFQIYPLGNIQEYAQHIPYNSEKKTFLEKTGRESFEVFKYVFKVPGDDKEYVVMWDYNVGLVRITPFFKCCKYSKTTPAKMLNMNPGLKEITHSITGGALVAQGYWMPYSCALAVCTTFCSHLAGALIPIFGPTFPSLCVLPEAPEHGRMIIDSQTVREAAAEAEAFRVQYSRFSAVPSSGRESYSPIHSSDRDRMSSNPNMRHTPPSLGRRLRVRRTFGADSPYGLTTDTDFDGNASESSGDGYHLSPITPASTSSILSASHTQSHSMSQPQLHGHDHGHGHGQGQSQHQYPVQFNQPTMTGWHTHNMTAHNANLAINISPRGHGPYHEHSYNVPNPNTFLSAIPRSTGLDIPMTGTGTWRSGPSKRRVEEVDADDEYDCDDDCDGETASIATNDKDSADGKVVGVSMAKGSVNGGDGRGGSGNDKEMEGVGDAERTAAWLLVKLSMGDAELGARSQAEMKKGVSTGLVSGVGAGVGDGVGAGRGNTAGVGSRPGSCQGPRIKRRRATSM
ncbi:hypothetical protein ONS95_001273 [Cadophora gregata]|uniref:uncharacterized protein n=1 Tax=Cadophora gregata TaxID=51156 RepID=UPI0026DC6592|nr:uncharacterized protein ONS95_001273 [Cadophora gregata]KAK0101915.1 hypothetical protein ONS96_005889 [Cadophora gregata f. sp. sojae]KAK0129344.1 hypothetical protein ONS95_001273 [Cadophora gregata]